MKSLVVYYSHSGNTGRIARKVIEALREKGQTDIFELKYGRKEKSFLSQFLYKLIPLRVKLGRAVPLNIKDYDLLCIGVPVWKGRPAPPVSAYIKGCRNVRGKRIVCFLTHGSKGDAEECLGYIKKILDKKGRPEIITMDIFWRDARDDKLVDSRIVETLASL